MRGMMSAGWKIGVGADCTVFGTSDEKAGRGNGEGSYLLVDLLACISSEKNRGRGQNTKGIKNCLHRRRICCKAVENRLN